MLVIKGEEAIPDDLKEAFVTIGNFDGVHLGHQGLFHKLISEAHQVASKAIVITFDPHPKMLLHPKRRPFYLITTLEEKVKLLEQCGLDATIIISFDLDYAQTSAEDFISRFLWEKLCIRKIFIGHDYTFGKGKKGNEEILTAYGKRLGFAVSIIDAVAKGDTVISSTGIRHAILRGDMKTASRLLGRPYNLVGTVIPGSHRGRRLGFPTANIKPEKELIPPDGIYAVFAELSNSRYGGLMNIGANPTFMETDLSLEVFLFDFDEDIYGEKLNVLFVEKIRAEIRFPSAETLVEQIRLDVLQGRKILLNAYGNKGNS